MSRLGPRLRIVRRLGTALPGLTSKDAERNPNPPGQHGATNVRRRKVSLFRKRLEEKQKVRFHYGITEQQLRRTYAMARTRPGKTGDVLLELLEARLDSVVFRLGFARTIPAARQLVVHGHVRVDGAKVDRPGFRLTPGNVISLGTTARNNVHVQTQVDKGPQVKLPSWLVRDPDDAYQGRMIAPPLRAAVPFIVDEAAIVEYYAR